MIVIKERQQVAKTDKYLIVQKFRPSPLPIKGLPLGLRGIGHYRVPRDHISPVRYTTYSVIAWGIEGRLRVKVSCLGDFDLTPGHLLVITAGFSFNLEVLSDFSEFRYMAIDGPQANSVVLASGLWPGIFPCREVPVSWLEDLAQYIEKQDKDNQLLAISRAHDLLLFQAQLAREMISDNLVYQAQWYFNRNWHDVGVNVESAIRYLNVDRATLSKKFKCQTGISMLEYLTTIRLANAKRLLKTSNYQIAEIAQMCGYRDPSYFSRLFRIKNSCNPMQFRLCNGYHNTENLEPLAAARR
jgi:AraC-like DNA-binding protein